MAYKWQLNGYEMEYLSEPLRNHYETIIVHWRIGMHLPEISHIKQTEDIYYLFIYYLLFTPYCLLFLHIFGSAGEKMCFYETNFNLP